MSLKGHMARVREIGRLRGAVRELEKINRGLREACEQAEHWLSEEWWSQNHTDDSMPDPAEMLRVLRGTTSRKQAAPPNSPNDADRLGCETE